MNLLHVVPSVSDEASGPSYSVPRLCEALARKGETVELSCLGSRGRLSGVRVNVHRQWPLVRKFAISSEFLGFLRSRKAQFDVVHNHSLWSMVNVATGCLVPGGRAKLVTSPRGTLSAWALNRSRHVKSLLWPWQRRVVESADLLHATSQTEYLDIRTRHLKAPVAVIPNGIDVPPIDGMKLRSEKRTLLFLGRIHPTKGVLELLDAWSQLEAAHPDWVLVIAGKGESLDERAVRKRSVALGLRRVEFPGPFYGEVKSEAYFGAELFILPSHSENFAMTVAEALAHGCPVIATKGTPWAGLEAERCGWWVAQETPNLAEAMNLAMSMSPDRLAAMGTRGRDWMARDFAWDAIAEQMLATYRWLLDGGAAPSWVRLN